MCFVFHSTFIVNDSEVFELEKSYHQMTSYQNRQYQITLQTFSNILTPVLPPILIPGFFDAFDQNRDGKQKEKVNLNVN